MNRFKKYLILALVVIPLSLQAQTAFYTSGQVLAYNNQTINLSDMQFSLLSTTKVFLKNNMKGQLSDLKLGDYAEISLIQIGKKRFVDTIQVIGELESNEENLNRE
jgi:hypothetical protein